MHRNVTKSGASRSAKSAAALVVVVKKMCLAGC